jgi:hypothetical protein
MTKARSTPTTVVERLLNDDYLHEQMAELSHHVRGAVGPLGEAARRLAGKPEPEPPKRRGRRVAVLLISLGLVVLVRDMHRRQQAAAASP